jgi:hypothetical protein
MTFSLAQRCRNRLTLTAVLACFVILPGRSVTFAEEWKFDVVHLKNGTEIQGQVIEDEKERVRIRVVLRQPGRPIVVITTTLPRTDVERVELADEKDREQLTERLKTLHTERQNWSALIRAIDPALKNQPSTGFDQLELKSAAWGKGSGKGLAYQSAHFRVVSNAREDLVCLTAVQLEQIYAAYQRVLPPRVEAAAATTVLLPQSVADYQALMKEEKKPFLNMAYYDSAHNQIVCPSELQQLSDDWAKRFQANQKELERLQDDYAKLKQLFKGNIPAALEKQNLDQRKKLEQSNDQNRKGCEAQLQKLFQPLFHEAFHAYLNNQVYPPADFQVPRWLNEGLAQLFETATLQAGELKIDRPDKDRLQRVQAQLRKGDLIALTTLLKTDHKQFLAIHNSEQQATDRYYLASWALTAYLVFDRNLLGTKALDDYARAIHRGNDPVDAFHDLVNQPLADFEKEFRQAVGQWKPDGFTTKGSGK